MVPILSSQSIEMVGIKLYFGLQMDGSATRPHQRLCGAVIKNIKEFPLCGL